MLRVRCGVTLGDSAPPGTSRLQRRVLTWGEVVSAASWMSGAHILAQAFAYGSLILLARLIPPESFGTIASATAIVWVAAMLMEAGTHGTIIVSGRLTPALLRRAFWRCLAGGTALAAVMAIGAEVLARTVAKGADTVALAVLALCLPLYAVAIVPVAVLQRAMEFRKLARTTAAANTGSTAVAILVALAGGGVWALVLRQLLWFGLLAALATAAARPHTPRRPSTPEQLGVSVGAPDCRRWFLLFGVTLVIAQNIDYFVIGTLVDADSVGIYALAFMIAFAPVHHFSNEVGKVLFAAAASDREFSAERTERVVRLMALLLMPLVPAAFVLAPTVLPAVLGPEWTRVITPFQVLLVVAVAHTVVDCVGDTLSGLGQISFRAKLNVAWCGLLLLTMVILVRADGIRGAAFAHLVAFVPYAAVYMTVGARRAGISPRALWTALRPALLALGTQAAATLVAAVTARAMGSSKGVGAGIAALAGLAALAVILARADRGLVREALRPLRAALPSRLQPSAGTEAETPSPRTAVRHPPTGSRCTKLKGPGGNAP